MDGHPFDYGARRFALSWLEQHHVGDIVDQGSLDCCVELLFRRRVRFNHNLVERFVDSRVAVADPLRDAFTGSAKWLDVAPDIWVVRTPRRKRALQLAGAIVGDPGVGVGRRQSYGQPIDLLQVRLKLGGKRLLIDATLALTVSAVAERDFDFTQPGAVEELLSAGEIGLVGVGLDCL